MSAYPAGEPFVHDIGHRHFIRPHVIAPDGTVRAWLWWHDCTVSEHISWSWIGDKLDGTKSGHGVPSIRQGATPDSLTVEGSLICVSCKDHGWIRSGRWVPC